MDFRAVSLVSLRLSPPVMQSRRNFLIFCNLLQLCGDISPNPVSVLRLLQLGNVGLNVQGAEFGTMLFV